MWSLCKFFVVFFFFFFFLHLQLSLRSLEGWGQQVAHLAGGFVQVVAHFGAAKTLGNDIEVDATFTSQSIAPLIIVWDDFPTYLFSLII